MAQDGAANVLKKTWAERVTSRFTFPVSLFPAVTNFNNGLEASSDSDDEDKLHIVEEDSLQEPEAATAAAAATAVAVADGTPLQDSHDATTTVLPHNGLNGGTVLSRKMTGVSVLKP